MGSLHEKSPSSALNFLLRAHANSQLEKRMDFFHGQRENAVFA